MRALCLLREGPAYRREAFLDGLSAAGFTLKSAIGDPRPDDAVIVWNRYSRWDIEARRFEAAGARVIVAENGYFGREWRDGLWYALSLNHHNGAGTWRCEGAERWDSWGLRPAAWQDGRELVILEQRGIGERGLASPHGWAEKALAKAGRHGRIRRHPANHKAAISLAEDLRDAAGVVTWGSAAALQALLLGVPVWYDCPTWIGRAAARPWNEWKPGAEPMRDDEARLRAFHSVAWAMWNLKEIASGRAFRHLLGA